MPITCKRIPFPPVHSSKQLRITATCAQDQATCNACIRILCRLRAPWCLCDMCKWLHIACALASAHDVWGSTTKPHYNNKTIL